jgi:hypothetical protein
MDAHEVQQGAIATRINYNSAVRRSEDVEVGRFEEVSEVRVGV